jgi:hypothetical protein
LKDWGEPADAREGGERCPEERRHLLEGMAFRVRGLGFWGESLRFEVWDLEFGVWSFEFRAWVQGERLSEDESRFLVVTPEHH